MRDKTVLALGFFDGIHVGHATLLRAAAALAGELDARSAVMTFDVHPDTLVTGESVGLINTPGERVELIRRVSGIKDVCFLPFTRETMHQPWDEFLARLTAERNAAAYVVGHDFRFGHRGEGDARRLAAWCARRGLVCRVIPAVRLGGVPVSSTAIRALLRAGDFSGANRLLGHAHLFTGVACRGFAPAAPELLPLPPGRAVGALTLPDGTLLPDAELVCRGEGVLLPRAVSGDIRIEFTGSFASEAPL